MKNSMKVKTIEEGKRIMRLPFLVAGGCGLGTVDIVTWYS